MKYFSILFALTFALFFAFEAPIWAGDANNPGKVAEPQTVQFSSDHSITGWARKLGSDDKKVITCLNTCSVTVGDNTCSKTCQNNENASCSLSAEGVCTTSCTACQSVK